MKPEMTHYAVIQLGYAIFGVGETDDKAVHDARQWLDFDSADIDEIRSYRTGQHSIGDLTVIPCTKKLHDYVLEHGTTTWADTDGGICLPGELSDEA